MGLFDTGVRPAIDDYIQSKRDELRDYGDYWSASSAGYCMRKNIMERLKVPHVTEDDARLQRVFEVGHIFHEWAQRITREAGLSIAQEVELQDEDLMIRGHFDDLILIKFPPAARLISDIPALDEQDRLILYDYTTAHSKSFHYSKGRPMSYYHKMQLGTYMYMLRQAPDGVLPNSKYHSMHNSWLKNLTEARILRISKDDLVMEEKQLLWGEDIQKEVLDYWETLNKYWNEKKMPPCTCADHEGGFMSREAYNPFYYEGEPCSLAWYELNKLKEK